MDIGIQNEIVVKEEESPKVHEETIKSVESTPMDKTTSKGELVTSGTFQGDATATGSSIPVDHTPLDKAQWGARKIKSKKLRVVKQQSGEVEVGNSGFDVDKAALPLTATLSDLGIVPKASIFAGETELLPRVKTALSLNLTGKDRKGCTFRCPLPGCGVEFDKKSKLTSHGKFAHKIDKILSVSLPCPFAESKRCFYVSANAEYMKAHVYTKHSAETKNAEVAKETQDQA